MLLGLTRMSAGSARVLGLPVPAQRARALARVGAIVEEPSFYPHLTGRENLKVAAAVRGPEARARIDGALHRVGLDKRAEIGWARTRWGCASASAWRAACCPIPIFCSSTSR